MSISSGALSAVSDWTILVYMAADNGLSEYAVQDINQMESATIPTGTNVIVQVDFNELSSPAEAIRYKITHDETGEIESTVLANLGEIDSGDWHSLKSFIKWGYNRYPANHKALIIWSHGDSWYKGNEGKWICPDNSSENIMSVSNGDIRSALSDCPVLDLLLFDACSMQTIEVLSEVMNKTAYVVGSEDIVPVTGYPYQDILPIWQGEPRNLALRIPELYADSYAPGGNQNPNNAIIKTSCSTIDTYLLPEFIAGISEFNTTQDIVITNLNIARQKCYSLNSYDAEVDIKELMTILSQHATDQGIITSANQKLSDIAAIVISYASLNYPVDIGRISIWMPIEVSTFINFWTHYNKLPLMHRWLNTLYGLAGYPAISLPAPVIIKAIQIYDRISLDYILMPYPDFQTVYYQYIGDYKTTRISALHSDSLAYNWGDGITSRTVSINVPDSKGWLYLYVMDRDGNFSDKDSIDVTEQHNKTSLIVYPNPAGTNDVINFEWKDYSQNQDTILNKLYIFDISGKEIKALQVPQTRNNMKKILASELPTGVYIAVVESQGKKQKAKFAVVR